MKRTHYAAQTSTARDKIVDMQVAKLTAQQTAAKVDK